MRIRFSYYIFFALILCLVPFVAYSKDKKEDKRVGPLLDKMIAAYGGEVELVRLKSYKIVWDVDAVARQDKGTDTRHVLQPSGKETGKLKVELKYSHSEEMRVFDGKAGFAFNGSEHRLHDKGPQLDAMREQMMRLYTPLTLKAKKSVLRYEEEGLFKVLVLKEGNVTGRYYVNPESSLIVRFSGSFDMNGMKMEFVTEYSEFKTLPHGLVWHGKETKYAGGVNTAVLTLKTIEPEYKFEKGIFNIPSKELLGKGR